MVEWWDGLTQLQQFFYCVAVPATVVMLIQTVLMIVGLGHGDVSGGGGPIDGSVGHDLPHDAVVGGHSTVGHSGVIHGVHDTAAVPGAVDHATGQDAIHADQADVASFRLFTFQSILAFLVVFGWTGIAMSANPSIPAFVTVVVALLAGTAALFLTAWMFYGLLKLQNSGNVRLGNAVGLEGEVYIPIPAGGTGQGKVNVLLQGRWLECDAVNAGLEPLKTRQAVRVVGLRGGSVLVVEPIEKDQ
jgi:membrane protein implicated in regulation of membrane protease activity